MATETIDKNRRQTQVKVSTHGPEKKRGGIEWREKKGKSEGGGNVHVR